MDYSVVYDVERAGHEFSLYVVPALMAGFGAMVIYDMRRATTSRTKNGWTQRFIYGLAGAFVLLGVLGIAAMVEELHANVRALEAGVPVFEGVVRDLVTERGTRRPESFTLATNAATNLPLRPERFVTPHAHVGLLREGQRVRVHGSGDDVLRLEIATRDVPGTLPPPRSPIQLSPYVLPVLGLFVVPLLYHGLARARRWRTWATRHPGAQLDDADGYLMETGVQIDGENFALHVRIGAQAFSLARTLPMGSVSDVVVIPWEAVDSVTRHEAFWGFTTVVALVHEPAEIVLRSRVGRALDVAFDGWCAETP